MVNTDAGLEVPGKPAGDPFGQPVLPPVCLKKSPQEQDQQDKGNENSKRYF